MDANFPCSWSLPDYHGQEQTTEKKMAPATACVIVQVHCPPRPTGGSSLPCRCSGEAAPVVSSSLLARQTCGKWLDLERRTYGMGLHVDPTTADHTRTHAQGSFDFKDISKDLWII
jgi:hypothetical protein